MKERSRQQRLLQLREARAKMEDNDSRAFDIDEEMRQINNPKTNTNGNPPQNNSEDASDEQYDKYFSDARNEPFGQDLGPEQEDDDEKQRMAREVLNQQDKPDQPETSPQAQAGATPKASPQSPKEAAAPKEPTGGWAKNMLGRIPGVGKAKPAVGGGAGASATAGGEGAAGAAAKTGQAAAKTGQALAKAGQAIGRAAVAIGRLIVAGGPVVWIIVGVGIILIIIIFVVGFSNIGASNNKVGATGGTELRQVNAKDDAGMLNDFANNIGGTTANTQSKKDAATAIADYAIKAKETPEVKGNTALEDAAKDLATKASALAAALTPENTTAVVASAKIFYNLLEGDIPVWPAALGSTRMPLTTITAETTFNKDIHGFSFLNNKQADNHNVYIRSADDKEMCDAVDIGVTSGADIFPIFGGKVKDVSSDGLDGSKVIISSTDGAYTALYAHITNSVKVMPDGTSHDLKADDDLNITEKIGIAASNNIQIEVYYTGPTVADPSKTENSCLVTNHADMLDHALTAQRHADWGGYLWDRVVKTFGLK